MSDLKCPASLSDLTWQIIQKMFLPQQQEEAGQLLIIECGHNLPFYGNATSIELERVRFAVLKISQSNLVALAQSIQQSQQDWRDTLMEAGFGYNVEEHNRWAKGYLG